MESLPTIPSITLLKDQWTEIKKLIEDGKDVQLAFDIP